MIPLFFLVVCSEGLVAFLLVVKIGPLRELVMKGLDQVKMRRATVLTIAGFSLFLGFLIDRMHHYMRKLIKLRGITGASKQEVERLEKEKLQLKEKEEKAASDVKRLQKEVSSLTENLKKLKLESTEKDKKVETAESHVAALQKQAADLLLEYDRLLEDNQNLQNQSLGYRN
ncbi:hypothetical protein F511_04768 [Dorcoceras hygrometricum]|uniref:Endoplasmic reticulum transmembrane protein n=1 Tax=Dorcoceras hygrometricum TaxID=472368 RepID=A0A2Z7B2F9_9LAMI|nr:hypothetical protein F511_04768 [Dorcoceras hygrometricum]